MSSGVFSATANASELRIRQVEVHETPLSTNGPNLGKVKFCETGTYPTMPSHC